MTVSSGPITLTGNGVTVSLLPEPGGKIVSLHHGPSGREWLAPPRRGPIAAVPPGRAFTDAHMCGWDEMFPTIVPCRDPADPQSGVMLPDHGELWAVPWTVGERSDSYVEMSAAGPSGTYTFGRTVRVSADQVIIDYGVTNHADTPLYALWAAHPQFAVAPTTAVVIPGCTTVVTALERDENLGPAGTALTWPTHRSPDGSLRPLDRLSGAERGTCWKVYADPEVPVGCARLIDGPDGPWLQMEWTAEAPYLGLWFDQMVYADEPVIAIEPATGYYDSAWTAAQLGRIPILNSQESMAWQVRIRMGVGSSP